MGLTIDRDVPLEIRQLLKGTKLKNEEHVVAFWNRTHPMLRDTPATEWRDGNQELVRAFIFMLKSGDGSMT